MLTLISATFSMAKGALMEATLAAARLPACSLHDTVLKKSKWISKPLPLNRPSNSKPKPSLTSVNEGLGFVLGAFLQLFCKKVAQKTFICGEAEKYFSTSPLNKTNFSIHYMSDRDFLAVCSAGFFIVAAIYKVDR